ncbi:MAG TPA: SAM-dependent methyltransferase [Pseudonocardiaceae bacterium]|jgi:SAM-dependent methyltransferase|nr:SAM-dependent methyltransferase [Pseudonocardiaceae bacterium]
MTGPDPALGKLDVDRPSSARIYDYFLGGAHNFEVDRKAADDMAKVHPGIGLGMQANRSYLRRAVRYLSDQGVDQFLDLGSGIPTVGNVHEIAQRVNPNARVVYVDIEPIAVTHSKTILAGNNNATAIQADLRDPEQVLNHPETLRLLDLSRPVALVLAGVLQYVDDDSDPAGLIAGYRDRLAGGSYLALSHPSTDNLAEDREAGAKQASSIYQRTATPFTYRTKAQFETFFAGVELVEPGIVLLWDWHPESAEDGTAPAGRATGLAGVGRKP